MNDPPLLQICNASVVKSGKFLLENLSLEIASGQHTAILGPNGSGKSTLIKLITRQLYPLKREGMSFSLSIFGRERWNVFELRGLLGIVSADLHQAFTGDDAALGQDVVLSGFFSSQGLARHHAVTSEMRERAQEALTRVEAAHLAERPLNQLSTGEARRVLIARALVFDPPALLLDEPTTGLDLAARRRFLETLRDLARQGKTLLLVTHHAEEIIPEIERVVLLQNGSVFEDGLKADLLTTETLTALFQVPVEVSFNGEYYRAEAA